MTSGVYQHILTSRTEGRKQLAVLIDPDGNSPEALRPTLDIANAGGVDYLLVGGSLLLQDRMTETLTFIRQHSRLPTIIFPANGYHIHGDADAFLLLSLISGRNPELLIGKHVEAAPYLRKSGLEVISCGYILIDGGRPTSVSYVSNTQPIPADKPDIAACTALAGAQLGLRTVYLDAGSGARRPVSETMIRAVRRQIDIPLLVGGGIRSVGAAEKALRAGADLLVVGTAVEREPTFLRELTRLFQEINVVN